MYTIKASSGRFLKSGNTNTSVPGQQGVAVSFSPIARTLDDLETFWRAVMSMKPWDYDHFVLPIPWREVDLSSAKGLRWGILWDDGRSRTSMGFNEILRVYILLGVVAPSPACHRALQTVVKTLEAKGHKVVTMFVSSLSVSFWADQASTVHPQALQRVSNSRPSYSWQMAV